MKSLPAEDPAPRTVPIDPFIPSGAESPRFPADYAIGPLGSGGSRVEAYAAAARIAAAAAQGKSILDFYGKPVPAVSPPSTAPAAADSAAATPIPAPEAVAVPTSPRSEANAVSAAVAALGSPVLTRIGSPEPERSGSVSYLVRFFSAKASATGEIRVFPAVDGTWRLDSFTLEPSAESSSDAVERPESFDPLTYKRFL